MVDGSVIEKNPKWRRRLSGEDGAPETWREGSKSCFSVGKPSEKEKSNCKCKEEHSGVGEGMLDWSHVKNIGTVVKRSMGMPQKKGCCEDGKALDDRSFLNNTFSAVLWRQFPNPIEGS